MFVIVWRPTKVAWNQISLWKARLRNDCTFIKGIKVLITHLLTWWKRHHVKEAIPTEAVRPLCLPVALTRSLAVQHISAPTPTQRVESHYFQLHHWAPRYLAVYYVEFLFPPMQWEIHAGAQQTAARAVAHAGSLLGTINTIRQEQDRSDLIGAT